LTAAGVAALAAALSASSPDKAPLAYFRHDRWALRPGTARLALSPAPTPAASLSASSSSSSSSGGGGAAVRLYGLGAADVSLLCALLGMNDEVTTVELDAPLLDLARPADLAALLAPAHGACALTQLVVASGGVPGPDGGPAGTAPSKPTGSGGSDDHGAAAAPVARPAAGSVAAYYAAARDAELNGPLLSARRRSSFSQPAAGAGTHGPGDATPRDAAGALAALLGSLRANASLKRLHLCLRPVDAEAEAAQNDYGDPGPSGLSGGPSGGGAHGGAHGGASSSSRGGGVWARRGVGGVPAWVAALGDGLAFNGSLEALLVRADGARLAQACPALADALASVRAGFAKLF
jgi:hypothetical protein